MNISSRMLKTDPPKSFSDAMFVLAKADTARSLIHDWNTNIESIGEEVKLHNAQLIQDFRDGKLHPVAFQKGLEPLPKRLKEPSKSWCQWFRQAWGWSMLSRSSDTQAWLSYDHPDMVMAREAVRELETVHGCHDGMIINYDQIWRCSYSTSTFKMAFKRRCDAGKRAKKTRPNPRFDKKAHNIKGARKAMTVLCLKFMEVLC